MSKINPVHRGFLISFVIAVLLFISATATGLAGTEECGYPDPIEHPEAYSLEELEKHDEPFTESELAQIAEIHAYIAEVNAKNGTQLYIPDAQIVKVDTVECKRAIDIFAQEIVESMAEMERLDQLFEAGDYSSFKKMPPLDVTAISSHH